MTRRHFISNSCSTCPFSWRCHVYPIATFDSVVNIFKADEQTYTPEMFECQLVRAARKRFKFAHCRHYEERNDGHEVRNHKLVEVGTVGLYDVRIPYTWDRSKEAFRDYEKINALFYGMTLVAFGQDRWVSLKNCILTKFAHCPSIGVATVAGEPDIVQFEFMYIHGDIV